METEIGEIFTKCEKASISIELQRTHIDTINLYKLNTFKQIMEDRTKNLDNRFIKAMILIVSERKNVINTNYKNSDDHGLLIGQLWQIAIDRAIRIRIERRTI